MLDSQASVAQRPSVGLGIERSRVRRKLIGIARWPSSLSPLFAHRARPVLKSVHGASTGGGNCSPGSSRLYRLGVSQAQKAKVLGDKRPRLRVL